ncbi:MAG: hypothetical protein ACTSUO_01020 [Candidatus Thorarchaeota archaeon]
MALISLKAKLIIAASVFLLVLAFVGYLYVDFQKDGYIISEERSESRDMEFTHLLEANHTYELLVGASDSEYDQDAVVRASFTIYIDGEETIVDELSSRDSVDRGEDDYDTDTSDGRFYFYTPSEDMNLTVMGELRYGDYWYIKLYQDIPPEFETHFIMTGIMALVGVIGLIGGAYVEDNARAYVEGRTDAQRSETHYS